MMDLFRKHKKAIYWVIILLVGFPFIFITTDYIPFMNTARNAMLPEAERAVAEVGGEGITGDELRQQLDAQLPPNTDGTPPDYRPLVESGKVDEVITNMVKGRLLDREAQKVDLAFNRDYLADTLKDDPSFKNEQGQFDAELWNSFVEEGRQRGYDWDAVYASVADSARRRIMGQRILAPARVRQSELREQYERDNTTVKLKYMPVEMAVEPTEAQIQAHYETNKAKYDIPAKRTAEFIAIPAAGPRPEALDAMAAQARQGGDFQQIAKQAPEGLSVQAQPGIWVNADSAMPEQAPVFYLQPGDVLGPVETSFGYAIFRVEDTRVDTQTGRREVQISQLTAFQSPTEAQRQAQDEKARAIAQKAANGDLAAAAAEAGLPVLATNEFSVESADIDNVAREDAMTFASGLENVEQGKVSDVIRGRKNLYVAKVTNVVPSVPQPLEAVRDRVVQDTIEATKQTPEYQARVAQLAQEIPQKVQGLDQAKSVYTDLSGEVKEIGPFTTKTYEFSQGPFWNVQEVVDAALKAGENKVAGPVRDFLGQQYFVELVEKTAPDMKTWADLPAKEKDDLRKRIVAKRQAERFEDYLDFLLLRADVPVTKNRAAIERTLGLDQPAATEEGAAPAEEAAAPAEGEAAPPVEPAPAPPAPTGAP